MRLRSLVLLVVLAVVVGVGVATWHGVGPLPGRERCVATLDGRSVDLAPDQAEVATLVAAIGISRDLPARAVSIALATAYQESKLRNIDYGDRDSLGIFQQRPSQGWGTAEQVRDPYYATNKFYEALEKIPDYQELRITEAAQEVQRSGFPEAYEDHAADARLLASVLTGYSGGGRFSCVVGASDERSTAAQVTRRLERAFGALDVRRTGTRQDLTVTVPDTEQGRRLGWAVAAFLVGQAPTLHPESVAFDGRRWRTGQQSEEGFVATKGEGAPATEVRISLG